LGSWRVVDFKAVPRGKRGGYIIDGAGLRLQVQESLYAACVTAKHIGTLVGLLGEPRVKAGIVLSQRIEEGIRERDVREKLKT
jgi:hypothetical protein